MLQPDHPQSSKELLRQPSHNVKLLPAMTDDDRIWAERIIEDSRRTRGSYARTNPDYVAQVDQRNLRLYLQLKQAGRANEFSQSLPREERQALRRKFEELVDFKEARPAALSRKRNPKTLNVEVTTLNREVAEYFDRHPEKLHDLTPLKFEQLIATLLEAMGAEVRLTKQTGDGGRDILAVFKTPIGDLLTIVECKKYRLDRCVGIELVERFMYVVTKKDHASCGLFATTSYFSPQVHALAKEHPFRLKLRDFKGIQEWVSSYGQWFQDGGSGIWRPDF